MVSSASGVSDQPLLGETIGANLERTVARFAEREALVDVAAGRRWTYAEFDAVGAEQVASLHGARWMHTGDLATMDDEGYVNIVGRIKDLVFRGGENAYPREVEEFLHTHPDIADVQVIGVPDAMYGEELMAWVVLRPGATALTADDVRVFCAGKLSHFRVPRYVYVVDGFPMTVTGKVRKVEMRERALGILNGGRS